MYKFNMTEAARKVLIKAAKEEIGEIVGLKITASQPVTLSVSAINDKGASAFELEPVKLGKGDVLNLQNIRMLVNFDDCWR